MQICVIFSNLIILAPKLGKKDPKQTTIVAPSTLLALFLVDDSGNSPNLPGASISKVPGCGTSISCVSGVVPLTVCSPGTASHYTPNVIPVAASKTFLIYYKLDQIDLNDQFNFKLHILLDANKPVCFTFLISNAIIILFAIHHW